MGLSTIESKDITTFTSLEAQELQRLLNNCGYRLVVDGIVGAKTIDAFSSFKKQHFLEHPTVFGKTTYSLLKRYDQDISPALRIIKEFEGLVLKAYVCPAGVMTIG